ncbi:MAG: dihydroneopterin aldolase [Candidatus Baltobacteraceae bacterium]
MDRVALRGIVVTGRHGANPGERDVEQSFNIDLDLDVDLSAAAQSDRLEDTVDYAGIHRCVVTVVGKTSFRLIERLAVAVLGELFSDARIVRAELKIGKPQLLDGATPSVTLVRDNPNYRAYR